MTIMNVFKVMCSRYWPDLAETVYADLKVQKLSERDELDCVRRTFQLTKVRFTYHATSLEAEYRNCFLCFFYYVKSAIV